MRSGGQARSRPQSPQSLTIAFEGTFRLPCLKRAGISRAEMKTERECLQNQFCEFAYELSFCSARAHSSAWRNRALKAPGRGCAKSICEFVCEPSFCRARTSSYGRAVDRLSRQKRALTASTHSFAGSLTNSTFVFNQGLFVRGGRFDACAVVA